MNKSESKYFNTAVKFDKALLSLLEKKPFEYITVSELCVEAGVNRSTRASASRSVVTPESMVSPEPGAVFKIPDRPVILFIGRTEIPVRRQKDHILRIIEAASFQRFGEVHRTGSRAHGHKLVKGILLRGRNDDYIEMDVG